MGVLVEGEISYSRVEEEVVQLYRMKAQLIYDSKALWVYLVKSPFRKTRAFLEALGIE